MNNYRQITFRYLKQNKKRTVLTILGIVLAVSLFSAIGTFFYSFKDNMIEREKIVGGNYEVSYLGLDKKQINYIKNNFNILSFGIENPEKTFDCLNENKNLKLNLTYYDYNNFKDIKKFNIVEGNTPKNINEILIEKKAIINLKKSLGDNVKVKINNEEKIYRISGFYKPKLQYSAQKYEAYGFLDRDNLKNEKIYNVFVRFKDKKNIRSLGKELGNKLGFKEKEINFNEPLLQLMMQGRSDKNNIILWNMIGIIVGIIVISTIAVIYNAFNISVAERIKQFGILRSIGASPSKIRRIVLKEGFIMCLISIPLGIVMGYVGLYIVVKILMYYYEAYALKLIKFNIFNIKFYPQVILISAVLGFITVFLSVISPAISASKISPMDAIRNSGKFKKEKIKRRKARLIRFIFGIEGQVAYKNIKRNNKRFIITIISLSVSFVMFVGFTSFMIVQKERIRYCNEEFSYDSRFDSLDGKIDENVFKKLKGNKYVKDIFIRDTVNYPIYVNSNFINNNFLSIDEIKKGINGLKIGGEDYFQTKNALIEARNETSLKSLEKDLVYGNIDLKALKEGGVILSDTNVKKENDKKIIDRITKYKVGDTIRIPIISKSLKENEINLGEFYNNREENIREKAKKSIEKNTYIEAKVIGIVRQCNIITDVGRTKLNLIFDKTAFENKFFQIPTREFEIKFNDNSEKVNNYFENFAECNSLMYVNYVEAAKQNKSMDIILNTFIYGFISIVSLISLINVVNTITMGLLLRKREFATLNAIGMTKRQLSKMVLLEGLIYGIIVSVIGSIASYGVFKLLLDTSNEIMEMPYPISKIVGVFIAGTIGINILTFIASLVPLRKFKKMNIIENIKEEE